MGNFFSLFERIGTPEQQHSLVWKEKNTNEEYFEIARLKSDGTFIVMGREYKEFADYIKEKEGIS